MESVGSSSTVCFLSLVSFAPLDRWGLASVPTESCESPSDPLTAPCSHLFHSLSSWTLQTPPPYPPSSSSLLPSTSKPSCAPAFSLYLSCVHSLSLFYVSFLPLDHTVSCFPKVLKALLILYMFLKALLILHVLGDAIHSCQQPLQVDNSYFSHFSPTLFPHLQTCISCCLLGSSTWMSHKQLIQSLIPFSYLYLLVPLGHSFI